MKLRWYQSRLFWLGLVALSLQLAVWIHFLRTDAYAAWSPDSRSQYLVGWGTGSIGLNSHHHTGFMGIDGGYNRFEYDFSSVEEDWEVDFFAPAFMDLSYGPPEFTKQQGRGFAVAHWVIVLAVFVLWMGAVIWNQRRKRKWLTEQNRSCPQVDPDSL